MWVMSNEVKDTASYLPSPSKSHSYLAIGTEEVTSAEKLTVRGAVPLAGLALSYSLGRELGSSTLILKV